MTVLPKKSVEPTFTGTLRAVIDNISHDYIRIVDRIAEGTVRKIPRINKDAEVSYFAFLVKEGVVNVDAWPLWCGTEI